ncbi:Ni/Fe-hydrogenase cytochrome b subunit [Planctomycetales bacterium ZRK34]|nr:Ni/Fe-hydrogenase cytochrome b subunit [Planctomycetales bacterium ZRK34]
MFLTKTRPQPLTVHGKPTCEDGHGCACAATAPLEAVHDFSVSDRDFDEDHHAHHEAPAPIGHKFLTPGVMVLLGLAFTGLLAAGYRFLFGLEASTNLDQAYPWGVWIGIDVASGVALAAGGFTTAALIHVFHREHYHAVSRPALLTAMLGYTFVALGLQADLGRFYNVWHPMIMWQGNSALFEVGMCVMCYLTVLYLEFTPIVCERLIMHRDRWPRLAELAAYVNAKLDKVMFLLVIAGCTLSCLHQSSLGTLMVIAPSKLHPLWWTPWLPLLFLLSAFMVGFPMVIWESLVASWSMKLKPEMNVLSPLARYVPVFMGIYLGAKLLDIHHRDAWGYIFEGSIQSWSWLAEMGLGVCLPMLMMMVPQVRRSRKLILIAASLIVLGVLWNRVNVFIIGFKPPYADHSYVPSFIELAVTVGLISTLILCYRLAVTYLPVIHTHQPRADS